MPPADPRRKISSGRRYDGSVATRAVDDDLRVYAEHIGRLEWSAMLLDAEWRLTWVSDQLKEFIREDDDEALGVGLSLVEAWTRDVWMRTATPESQLEVFQDLAPIILKALRDQGVDPTDVLPEQFHPLLPEVRAGEIPFVWSGSFVYVDPDQPELPSYRVNMCFLRLHDAEGRHIGAIGIFFMGMRPNLTALLIRGNESMYERMAKLTEPAPREAAIMFCDLHESGRLSRMLSSATYFKLVRRLWTGLDSVVAEECGVIGKHAGDGASAFFLVDDLGDASKAVRAAIHAARRIHRVGHEVFKEVFESPCQMRIGLHWGGSLYMGQLVPGGRLDVTALGDEVNEAARIQDCAGPHETLVSKQLLEQLTAEDAAALDVMLDRVSYKTIAEIEGVSEAAARDAGAIAVTQV